MQAGPQTDSRSSGDCGVLPVVGIVLAVAALLAAPGLVTIALYLPVFEAMTPVGAGASGPPAGTGALDSFGRFGAWAVVPILVTLPGLVVSLVALGRTPPGHERRALAVAGVVCGGLAFAVVTAFTVYVYAAA